MDKNTSKRQEIYNAAPELIQELYGSDLATKVIKKAVEAVGIDSEPAHGNFVIAVGDVILGLYKKEFLGQLLKDRLNFSEQQVSTAIESLQELLDKIPEANITPPIVGAPLDRPDGNATDDGTQSSELDAPTTDRGISSGYVPPSPPQTADTPPRNTTTAPEENKPKLKGIRTFADDVNISRAHGYGAFHSQNGPGAEEEEEVIHSSSQDDALGKGSV